MSLLTLSADGATASTNAPALFDNKSRTITKEVSMTTTNVFPSPVVGWNVSLERDNCFFPSNKEVCDAYGVQVPYFLEGDGCDIMEHLVQENRGWDDAFSALVARVASHSNYEPHRTFDNANVAGFYQSALEDIYDSDYLVFAVCSETNPFLQSQELLDDAISYYDDGLDDAFRQNDA
jgi:hypothetical protein